MCISGSKTINQLKWFKFLPLLDVATTDGTIICNCACKTDLYGMNRLCVGMLLPLRISEVREWILHTEAKCERAKTWRALRWKWTNLVDILHKYSSTTVYIGSFSYKLISLRSSLMTMMSASQRWTCQLAAKADTCKQTHTRTAECWKYRVLFFVLFELYHCHWIIYFFRVDLDIQLDLLVSIRHATETSKWICLIVLKIGNAPRQDKPKTGTHIDSIFAVDFNITDIYRN